MELETKLFPGPLLYRSPGMTEDTGQSLYRLNDAAGAPGFSKRIRFESGEGAEGGERGQVTFFFFCGEGHKCQNSILGRQMENMTSGPLRNI